MTVNIQILLIAVVVNALSLRLIIAAPTGHNQIKKYGALRIVDHLC